MGRTLVGVLLWAGATHVFQLQKGQQRALPIPSVPCSHVPTCISSCRHSNTACTVVLSCGERAVDVDPTSFADVRAPDVPGRDVSVMQRLCVVATTAGMPVMSTPGNHRL